MKRIDLQPCDLLNLLFKHNNVAIGRLSENIITMLGMIPFGDGKLSGVDLYFLPLSKDETEISINIRWGGADLILCLPTTFWSSIISAEYKQIDNLRVDFENDVIIINF